MKRAYKMPLAKKVDFQYDTQVVADSGGTVYCDQGWTKQTELKIYECKSCINDLIWINTTDPWAKMGLM